MGRTLGNLGIVYREQGHLDRAIEIFSQAIDVCREVGDKRSEGINLGNLGNVYQNQGQCDSAIEHLSQALAIAREIGDKRFEGINHAQAS